MSLAIRFFHNKPPRKRVWEEKEKEIDRLEKGGWRNAIEECILIGSLIDLSWINVNILLQFIYVNVWESWILRSYNSYL